MAAKACGDGRPHGTATFEGGVLGDELEVSKLGILLPRSIGRRVSGDHNIPKTDVTNVTYGPLKMVSDPHMALRAIAAACWLVASQLSSSVFAA